MESSTSLLDMDHPFRVTTPDGTVRLVVTDDPNKVSLSVAAFMHQSPRPIGVRLAGGCQGMEYADKLDMLRYFVEAFRGFRGFVSSGGTRAEAGGKIAPMITDVPAALINRYGSDILSLGTTPRTAEMFLRDDSRLTLDESNGAMPQPGVHMLIVFQAEYSSDQAEWDGDVKPYFELFQEFVNFAGWIFGMTVWNGGGITEQEALMAAQKGWPVFLVRGSGRKADELAERCDKRLLPRPEQFVIVDRSNPQSLRDAFIERQLIIP